MERPAFEVLNCDVFEGLEKIPSASMAAVVTDPPYCSGGRQPAKARQITSKIDTREDAEWFLGDTMGQDTYLWFLREIARRCLRIVRPGGVAYVMTDWRMFGTVVAAWESAGWTLRTCIVWDKASGGQGYYWLNAHEFVVCFARHGSAKFVENKGALNVFRVSRPRGGLHPTEKPVELMRYVIDSLSPDLLGGICDPFTGSGTTGVAAVMAGRSFLGIEQDPTFCKEATARIEAALAQGSLFDAAPSSTPEAP